MAIEGMQHHSTAVSLEVWSQVSMQRTLSILLEELKMIRSSERKYILMILLIQIMLLQKKSMDNSKILVWISLMIIKQKLKKT